MKITFLGTGTSQGVPIIACPCAVCNSAHSNDKRLRSSILIEIKDKNILIDAGPDFRYQMLRAKVKKLDAIFFTHDHKDHIAGLDDIRAFNHLSNKPMDIYAEKRVQNSLKREFAYVFARDKYPGIPKMTLHTLTTSPIYISDIEIIPIRVMHYRLPILAYRIDNFTYITDANFISNEEIEKIKGTEVLVINALRKEPHISHFNLDEALNLISTINPKISYLTHISHALGFHEEVQKELPNNVFLAYDNLELNL